MIAMKAKVLLDAVRQELEPLNQRILSHPYVVDAEEGRLPPDKVKLFVGQQYYIVSHDIKSIAIMVSRARYMEETEYFNFLLQGDIQALSNLLKMADSLGIPREVLERYELIPDVATYTHYLAFLASHATPGEQSFALIVNLPVWGSACGRLGRALKKRYGVGETTFLDAFESIPDWVEKRGLEIVDRYLPKYEWKMRRAAKLIQAYELMFWDGVYRSAIRE